MKQPQRFQFRIQRQDFNRFVHIHCYMEGPRGQVGILPETPQFILCQPDDPKLLTPASPLLNMNEADCQTLADELWRAGFKPSESHGSTGKINAVEHHLAHVTRLLDVTLPALVQQLPVQVPAHTPTT